MGILNRLFSKSKSDLIKGKVKRIYDDPDNSYRILVTLSSKEDVWSRMSNMYASSNSGSFFFPEVGDEVILGYVEDDIVILGSLYSSNNKPPLYPDEKNSQKGIITKEGISILFDDENKELIIKTPSNNKFILSDKNKEIRLVDQNGNGIVLGDSGIEIKSDKSITLRAPETIEINGECGVRVSASGGDISLNSMDVNIQADCQFSASGEMTSQLQGGTELTLKGDVVMIN